MRIRFAVVVLSAALPLSFMASAIATPSSLDGTPAPGAVRSPHGDGITLTVTLGSDVSPGACGTDTTLVATRGDQVNICYTVTNTSGETLTYHSLTDDVTGPILTDVPATIAPGASYQYNRIIVASDSEAPTATWTAYNEHPDYAMTVSGSGDAIFASGFDDAGGSPGFIDIAANGGTNLMLNDDDFTIAQIGFPFTFYGRTADSLTVSNNGGMMFDQVPATNGRAGYVGPTPRTLPDRIIGAAILPYWEDLHEDYIDGIGDTFVETIGAPPNRKFIVEWFNLPVNFGTGTETVTLEAILSEGSNAIDFVYADTSCGSDICDNGAGATIGINEDALHAVLYSFKQPDVTDGTIIHFEPTDPNVYTATAQATLDVGAPVVTVDPASFDRTVAAGASTSDTLTIGNDGDRDLTWNVGSIDTRAHFPIVPRFALPVGDPSATHTGPAPSMPRTKWLAPRPDGLAGVPAFAADVINAEVVGFDANTPGSLTSEFSVNGLQFLAGDFKGEDFSTLYAIDFRSFDLYKVDTATGATTLVFLAIPPDGAAADGWNGLAWDATTDTMFAVTSGGRTASSSLIKIDPDTAETELVGTITGVGDPTFGTAIIDIAVDANGLMYGVDIVTDTLVAIDKTTGEAQTIGSIGFDANFSEGLDFDDTTGTLYFSAYDQSLGAAEMYTLDTETGAGTLIGPIGPDAANSQYPALAIARLAGICAYPDDVPWLAFSTTRGSTAPGDTTPVGVTFDASSLTSGAYTADICVNSNDVANKRLAVPVTLTVE